MHKFSRKSLERLFTCHKDLKIVAIMSLADSDIDFGIAEGHRSLERQKELFDLGKSKIDGINRKGKHNHSPSLAFDVYAWVSGRSSYDVAHLAYIAGVVQSTAKRLYDSGVISHLVRWGGNWDRDGEIISDQTFDDLVHFELVKP